MAILFPPCRFLTIAFTGILLLFGPASLRGQTWDGGGADNNWGTAANWSGDTLPVNGNSLFFDGATRTSNTNNMSLSIASLTFNATASAFSLSGGNLTMTGSIASNNPAANVITINLNRTSSSAITNVGAYGTLELAGVLSGDAGIIRSVYALGSVLRITNDNNDFTGEVTLRPASSITEFTSVANAGSPSALGAATGASSIISLGTVGSNANPTLRYIGSSHSSTNRTIFLQGTTGSRTLDASGSGSVKFLGLVTSSTDGDKTLVLTGTSTAANEIAAIPNDSGSTTTSLTKSGAGQWVLSGNNTYTGNTTISDGTLTLNRATGSIAAASALTMGGATFNMDNTGASGALSQSLGALTFTAGDSTVRTTRTVAHDRALTFSSLAARPNGTTANFVNGGGTNSATNGINLTGVAADFINQGTFYGGSDYAWMNAAGTYVRGISYSSDTGAVTSGATTTLANATHQQITGAISAQSNATFTTLKIDGNHDFTLNASQTVTVNGILKSANTAGGATISGGSGIRAASGVELVIRTDGADDALTINSPVLANGANVLTKSGAGTLTLSGPNTYTGQTYVNGGTLSIGANVNLGAQGTGATLNLNNGTLQATGTFGLYNGSPGTNNRGVSLTNTTGFDVTSGNTLTVAGRVRGTGSLTKTNNGTLSLSASNNDYSGATTVNAGTLLVSGAGAINSTSSVTVNNDAIFSYSSSTGLTRNVLLNAGGTFIHTGANNYTGRLTWNGGTLAGTNWNGNLDNLSVGANRTISPGNSTGTASTGTQTWEESGSYVWEINDAEGTAGDTVEGWDLLNFSGALTLNASSSNTFTIYVTSLQLDQNPGFAENFSSSTNYEWLIADAGSEILAFADNKFFINTDAFDNAFTGDWAIVRGETISGGNNSQLYLTYTIPEPSAAILIGLGLASLVLRRRTR